MVLVLHGLNQLVGQLLLLLHRQLKELLPLLELVIQGHNRLLLVLEVSAHKGVLMLGLLQALDNELLLLLVLGDSQDHIIIRGHRLVNII